MFTKIKIYGWLLGINLFISTFTFGGGYIVVPMVRRYFVEQKNLFNEDELMTMAAIAQSSPGAIAINLSALAGYKAAGIGGAVISCIAAVMPPFFILSIISVFYELFITNAFVVAILKGMEATVVALMVDLIIDMWSMILKEKSLFLSLMIPIAFAANFILHINAIYILLVSCFICIIQVGFKKRGQI